LDRGTKPNIEINELGPEVSFPIFTPDFFLGVKKETHLNY